MEELNKSDSTDEQGRKLKGNYLTGVPGIELNLNSQYTVKPRYIATIGKREFWRYNEFGDRSRAGFMSVTCRHSKFW